MGGASMLGCFHVYQKYMVFVFRHSNVRQNIQFCEVFQSRTTFWKGIWSYIMDWYGLLLTDVTGCLCRIISALSAKRIKDHVWYCHHIRSSYLLELLTLYVRDHHYHQILHSQKQSLTTGEMLKMSWWTMMPSGGCFGTNSPKFLCCEFEVYFPL